MLFYITRAGRYKQVIETEYVVGVAKKASSKTEMMQGFNMAVAANLKDDSKVSFIGAAGQERLKFAR